MCSFTFAGFCRFAGGKGGLICRLPAAKETTGKTPCIGTVKSGIMTAVSKKKQKDFFTKMRLLLQGGYNYDFFKNLVRPLLWGKYKGYY